MSEWLVSLDFGTTATAAAVCSGGGEPRALTLADGSSTVPSSVFCESDGRLLVGVEADNEAELRLDAYEPTPKRRTADDRVRLGEHEFSPAELIGAVMAPVLAEAVRQHNDTVPAKVVLTHPVSWRAQRRAVMAEALSVAQTQLGVSGFAEPVFVAEPVAAARWYTHTDPAVVGSYFAVYDLGGGTFDTTVLRAAGAGQFDVVASGGIDPLGGFDFDVALFTYLGQRYVAAADPELWAALSRHSEGSSKTSAAVMVAARETKLPSPSTATVANGSNWHSGFAAHGLIHSSGRRDVTLDSLSVSPNSTADMRVPRGWVPGRQ